MCLHLGPLLGKGACPGEPPCIAQRCNGPRGAGGQGSTRGDRVTQQTACGMPPYGPAPSLPSFPDGKVMLVWLLLSPSSSPGSEHQVQEDVAGLGGTGKGADA